MIKTLRELYPFVRERQEILQDIMDTPELKETFLSWEKENQEHFLDFCSGTKGVKMLYDGFFKEIFNPDTKPQRLEELLSLILKEDVKILHAIPNDSSRIAAESSLLVMDVIVQLKNGSLANVECQKIGYLFMGQRAACYSADLLLRQYKRLKDEKKKNFSYKDIKKVYSIIFYESSPEEFKEYPVNMMHHFQQVSDTGLELELLQEYIFIPLDIVNQIYQNKGVTNSKLEAWFIFLSNDNPTIIAQIIEDYPEFKKLYHEVFEVCKNTKRVMNMFSEELKILDRNTVQIMIEQAQKKADQYLAKAAQYQAEAEQYQAEAEQYQAEAEQYQAEAGQYQAEAEQKAILLEQKNAQLEQKDAQLKQKDAEIALLKKQLAESKKYDTL